MKRRTLEYDAVSTSIEKVESGLLAAARNGFSSICAVARGVEIRVLRFAPAKFDRIRRKRTAGRACLAGPSRSVWVAAHARRSESHFRETVRRFAAPTPVCRSVMALPSDCFACEQLRLVILSAARSGARSLCAQTACSVLAAIRPALRISQSGRVSRSRSRSRRGPRRARCRRRAPVGAKCSTVRLFCSSGTILACAIGCASRSAAYSARKIAGKRDAFP